MKTRRCTYYYLPLLASYVLLSMYAAANGAPFTWDGGTGLYNSLNWNGGTATGPTLAADSAVINSGQVNFAGNDTFGNHNTTVSPTISIGTGGTLASNGFYNTFISPTLNGGTLLLSGGVNGSFPAFGIKGTLSVTGSSPSSISLGGGTNNLINIGPSNADGTLIVDVADVTVSAAIDLTVGVPLQNQRDLGGGASRSNGLTKQGAGTMTLNAANTYTGTTLVTAGILSEGASGFIADTSALTVNGATAVFDLGANHSDTVATVTVAGGGQIIGTGTSTLSVNGPNTLEMQSGSVSARLAGTAVLNKSTSGTVILSGANTYGGATNINAGTLTVQGGAAIPDTSRVVMANTSGAIFNLAAAESIGSITGGGASGGNVTLGGFNLNIGSDNTSPASPFAGTITGAGASTITKIGTGTQELSGAISHAGNTISNNGTLVITGSISSSSSRFIAGLGVGTSGTISFNTGHTTSTWGGSPFNSANYVGVDGGTGTMNVNAGTVNLTGMASGGGHLHIGSNSGPSNGTVNLGGGILNVGTRATMGVGYPGSDAANTVGNTGNGNATLTINSGTMNIGTGTGADTDRGFLYLKSPTGGTGTATVNLNGGTLSLQKFQIGSGGTSKSINFNGGTVQARANQANFLDAGATTNVAGGAVFDTNGFNIAVGSALLNAGAGGLTKSGLGTLTLSGANTYVGNTVVNTGTLALSTVGTNNIANSAVISLPNAGSVLDVASVTGGFALASGQTLKGIGTVTGNLTVAVGSFLEPGNSPGILTVGGNLSILGTLNAELQGNVAGSGYDQLQISTPGPFNATLGGTLTPLFSGTGWSIVGDKLWIVNNLSAGILSGVFSNFPTNGQLVTTYDGKPWNIYYGADFATQALSGGNDVVLTAVPEPSSLALLGFGLVGLARMARRRK